MCLLRSYHERVMTYTGIRSHKQERHKENATLSTYFSGMAIFLFNGGIRDQSDVIVYIKTKQRSTFPTQNPVRVRAIAATCS